MDNPEITETDFSLPATDGFGLAATTFEKQAGGKNFSWIVISPATATRRQFYAPLARYLVSEGFCVLTYDYRGQGQSRPVNLRGFSARMSDWGEKDMAGAFDWAARKASGNILAIGHSSGGELFGLAGNNTFCNAALFVGSTNGYYGNWDGWQKIFLMALCHIALPVLPRLLGYTPGKHLGLGADLPKGVGLQWGRYGRNPAYIVDDHGKPFREGYESFTGDMLLYSFSDDSFAPKKSVDSLVTFYKNANARRRHISPQDLGEKAIGHFGFFRENFRETLWRDTTDWLKKRAG